MRRLAFCRWCLLAVAIVTVAMFTACNDDENTDAKADPAEQMTTQATKTSVATTTTGELACPTEAFSTNFTPPDWTGPLTDVCVTPDRRSVLLKNTSTRHMQVQPVSGVLRPVVYPDATSFRAMVGQSLADILPIEATGAVTLPPGSYVVADAQPGYRAGVRISIPLANVTLAWAAEAVVGYMENRIENPTRAYAERVAACADEFSTANQNGQLKVPLTQLLADAGMGIGYACSPLFQEIWREADEPPPRNTSLFADELSRFTGDLKANFLDDLFRWTRATVNIVLG